MAVAADGDRFGTGRVDHHRPPAAAGPSVAAPVRELRRHLRAPGRRAERDRRDGDRRRRARGGPTCRSPARPAGGSRSRPTNGSRSASRWPSTTPAPSATGSRPSAGDLADSATGSLPAYTPTTTEAFATYGVIDDGAVAQPLLTPKGVVEQFGGLDVDTSSTSLQALTDAVVYLTDYDYESADAYAARITALVALRDVFAAFEAPGQPDAEQLDETIRADLEPARRAAERRRRLRHVAAGSAVGSVPHRPGGARPGRRPSRGLPGERGRVRAAASSTCARSRPASRRPGPRTPSLAARAYALHVRDLAGDRDPGGRGGLYRSAAEPPLDVARLAVARRRRPGDQATRSRGPSPTG